MEDSAIISAFMLIFAGDHNVLSAVVNQIQSCSCGFRVNIVTGDTENLLETVPVP